MKNPPTKVGGFLHLFAYFLHCLAELEEEQCCSGCNCDNVRYGLGKIYGKYLVLKEVGEDIDKGDKQYQLAEYGKEDGRLRVSDTYKGLLTCCLYTKNDKACAVDTQSPCGKVAKLNVAGEQGSYAVGAKHDEDPYAYGENKADYQQQAESALNTLRISSSEVVADDRLCTLGETHENEEGAVHNGGENSHCANCGISAVFKQGRVKCDVQ